MDGMVRGLKLPGSFNPPLLVGLWQVDLQRARLPQTRAKGEYEMENTIKILQHKESKLSGA